MDSLKTTRKNTSTNGWTNLFRSARSVLIEQVGEGKSSLARSQRLLSGYFAEYSFVNMDESLIAVVRSWEKLVQRASLASAYAQFDPAWTLYMDANAKHIREVQNFVQACKHLEVAVDKIVKKSPQRPAARLKTEFQLPTMVSSPTVVDRQSSSQSVDIVAQYRQGIADEPMRPALVYEDSSLFWKTRQKK